MKLKAWVLVQMCEGLKNPQKNVWLNRSIHHLNKTFLLIKKPKNLILRKKRQNLSVFGLHINTIPCSVPTNNFW